jgi:hypothetical protein
MVQVGTAGYKNLESHRASKACRQAHYKQSTLKGARLKKPKPNQVLDAFFKPLAPLNPSTVSAPPSIRPGEGREAFTVAPEYEPLAHAERACHVTESSSESLLESSKHILTQAPAQSQGQLTIGQPLAGPDEHHFPADNPTQSVKACRRGVSLLQDLAAAVNRIPSGTPTATPEHRLSVFAVDPHSCVAEPGEDSEDDDWAIVNQMMNSGFGWGETEMAAVIPQLLNRGNYGLDGFIRFMTFFVRERGLQGALFETKVEALLKELENR